MDTVEMAKRFYDEVEEYRETVKENIGDDDTRAKILSGFDVGVFASMQAIMNKLDMLKEVFNGKVRSRTEVDYEIIRGSAVSEN